MSRSLEVLLAPAEFDALPHRTLADTTCVVFDVLRATTSMITALAHGARAIVPVADISEALAHRRRDPAILLAGERDGVRIRAAQADGVEFDLGNSPREFVRERVGGRTLVMTTTNGTRALRACRGARLTLPAAFLNLGAVARALRDDPPARLIIICSGTYEEAALEDTLAAGALCDRLWPAYAAGHVADSAHMARELHARLGADLPAAIALARNGRRLLAQPELREDVAFSLRQDTVPIVAVMDPDGWVHARDRMPA
jgi:2-phosphosulfolactate phosphatase